MTAPDHYEQAQRLMRISKQLKMNARNRGTVGAGTRAGWDKRADELMAEAQVHATLSISEARRS